VLSHVFWDKEKGDEENGISWTCGARRGSFRLHRGGTDGIACFVWAAQLLESGP
jgi:hypothetical protein